jgi:hypothetical protein
MNHTLKTIAAATFLFAVAAIPLRAQTNLETGTSNRAVMTGGAWPATNPPVSGTLSTDKTNSPVESTLVRADDNGVHIGGENPVDVKPGLPAVLALLVPFAPFVMIVSIIAIVFYFGHHRNKMAHETLRAMIEKGMPVTPELVANLKNKGTKRGEIRDRGTGRLLVGLILVGVGMGTIAIAGKSGLIPLFIGVAFLAVWLVERGNANHQQPPNQPPPGQ